MGSDSEVYIKMVNKAASPADITPEPVTFDDVTDEGLTREPSTSIKEQVSSNKKQIRLPPRRGAGDAQTKNSIHQDIKQNIQYIKIPSKILNTSSYKARAGGAHGPWSVALVHFVVNSVNSVVVNSVTMSGGPGESAGEKARSSEGERERERARE